MRAVALTAAYEEYERGNVVVTSIGGHFHIDHADPRALISAELIDQVRIRGHLDVELAGDLLYLRGLNRTVIYRVLARHPQRLAYCIEWPD